MFGIQIVWFLDVNYEIQLWKLLNKTQYRYWTLHFKCNSFIPLDVKRTKNLRWFSFLPEYSNSFMQKPKERKQKSQHTIFRPQGLIWCIPLTIEKSFFYCRRQIFFVRYLLILTWNPISQWNRGPQISADIFYSFVIMHSETMIFLFDTQTHIKIYVSWRVDY